MRKCGLNHMMFFLIMVSEGFNEQVILGCSLLVCCTDLLHPSLPAAIHSMKIKKVKCMFSLRMKSKLSII